VKRISELNKVHGQLEIMEEDAIMWMLKLVGRYYNTKGIIPTLNEHD
jgi:hypothetical protein